MKVIKKINVNNFYAGSNWDFEKTTKYIIEIDNIEVEAGYFEHYKDQVLKKTVLELPQSYGCPAKCCFCASSGIQQIRLLDAEELEDIFLYLYYENHLENNQYVLLTMTGMGDIAFNYNNVEQFLLRLKHFDNLYVTLSSSFWNKHFLDKVCDLDREIRIRNIQITFVTSDINILSRIVPYYQYKKYDFDELIDYIEQSRGKKYRINYIMIKGINDTRECFECFNQMIRRVKEKVVVRISKLNETKATKRNQLQTTDINALEELQKVLRESGIKSYVFFAYKNDNMNCGQLITERIIDENGAFE